MSALFERRHYEFITNALATTRPLPTSRAAMIQWLSTVRLFSRRLGEDNPDFDGERFVKACQERSGAE